MTDAASVRASDNTARRVFRGRSVHVTRWLILTALVPAAPATGAPAPVHPVTTTYGTESLVDPYRWMENQGPDYLSWVHAQNAVEQQTLTTLPGYAAFAKQVTAASNAETKISSVQPVGKRIYYEKLASGDAQASLYSRALAGGPEQRLVDPVALGDAGTSIHEYAVSPDNRMLAICLAKGGSEDAVMQIMELASGRMLPERIDRAAAAGPVWSQDGGAVFYTRLKSAYGRPSERFQDETIFRHRPGDDAAHDVPIFTAAGAGSALGKPAYIGLILPPGSATALAFANSGVSKDAEWFAVPTRSLSGDSPHWRRIAPLSDRLVLSLDGNDTTQPVIRGNQAWFASLKDADRGEVVRIDLDHPGPANETVVVPQQATRLSGFAGTKDGLILAYASGIDYRLARTGYAGGALASIPVPYQASLDGIVADPRQPAAIVGLQSWARQATYFQTTARGLEDLHLAPPFALDLSDIVTDTVVATAADGVRIPISVTHRRDLRRDGTAPTLAEAYGAYGFSYDPVFHPELVPFLERGGVWAVAHVRGGGEFGESWHLAGMQATKPNTWHDFIASVEALETAGFTSPRTVTGFGASAGGVMIGRTVTERPDLLAGAVMWAPVVNTLRVEMTETGPMNTAEYGSIATPDGYRALRTMDSYSHIMDGTKYPAVLITVGLNDHRVPSWMGAEMAARLQAASRSGKPILLRVDDQGGHHVMGVSKADADAQITDMLAFVLMQAGDPAFQPPAMQTRR